MDITPFLPLITGALGGAVSTGVFKGPVNTLQDWWYVNYGYEMSEQAALLKAKQEINIEKLKNSTLSNVSRIDPENIQEPKMKILGPALEASRFYIEEDDIREMFAKLISSSMDKSKNSVNHPAFVEILKQMTSLDAENIFCIFNNDNQRSMICNLKIVYEGGSFNVVYKNLFLDNPKHKDQKLLGASLVNLERLGLVKSTYTRYKMPLESYDIFKNSNEYHLCSRQITDRNEYVQQLVDDGIETPMEAVLPDPEIEAGLLELTSLGINFCSICL